MYILIELLSTFGFIYTGISISLTPILFVVFLINEPKLVWIPIANGAFVLICWICWAVGASG